MFENNMDFHKMNLFSSLPNKGDSLDRQSINCRKTKEGRAFCYFQVLLSYAPSTRINFINDKQKIIKK